MEIRHFNITVSGKVQGVFYRQSTSEKAISLGLKGFVRNEPNGDVYIEAEGEENILNEFADWCRKGPPKAKVESLKITEAPLKNFTTFKINR